MLNMFTRLFIIVCCVATPVFASAWTLTGSMLGPSGSGQITVTNATPVKTITGGTGYATISGTSDANVTVTPTTPGYSVSRVLIDSVIQTNPDGTPKSGPFTIPYANANHSIQVTFAAPTYTVSVTQSPGGTVSIQQTAPNVSASSLTSLSGIKDGATIKVNASPNTDNKVISITAGGVTSNFNGGPGVIKSMTYTPTQSGTVTATYILVPNYNITLTMPSTAFAGTNVTADASSTTSNDTGLMYAFTVKDSGNTTIFSQVAGIASSFTFKPTVVGTCTIFVTVTSLHDSTGSTRSAILDVTSSVDYSNNVCISCHSNSTPGAISLYNRSLHSGVISCMSCHTSTPHTGTLPTGSVCAGCHFDATGNVPLHPIAVGTNSCISCHNPHTTFTNISSAQGPHFNNITSGMYRASYVTSRAACSNCHFPTANNVSIRFDWSVSGHGDTEGLPWIEYDFKTKNGCIQCHTTTGFIAYSSGRVTTAWGVPADKSKELLTCIGCHTDISTGTLRSIPPRSPYADNHSYTNPDVGKSNICLSCHAGRESGLSITALLAANADFTNMAFIDPHGRASGGTLFKVVGYRFPGSTFSSYSSNTHQQIGVTNTNNTGTSGPCITCHKSANFGHTFMVSTVVPVCANCHTTAFSDAQLSASQADYVNALDVLRAQLDSKGFVYSPNPPHFTTTNWGAGQDGANRMGAAFNYALLINEPGAFAHNSSYAKKLVIDSIDYLDNGVIDDSVATIALPGLVASGAISQAVADSLNSYTAKNSCNTCHGGTAASSVPMSSNAHGAHLTSAYGPSTYLGASLGACQTCHVYNGTQHMNRVVDVLNGAGTACANCHSGNVPVWSGTARLACTSCHSANPAVLPNGVAAPYKANFTSAGHGRFAASNQCTACHDPDSSHISGSLGTYVRLRLSNDNSQCGSCHNGTTAPAMSSHVLNKGGASNTSLCKECHDAHGTSNLHMIKTVINGRAVAFTNTSTGFVKMVAPFDGLCQVCHTLTSHFRSGQAPDGHPDRDCLSCHSHTAAFAFMPAGACDSCHGYPPAPAGFVGSHGNFTSARVESYLGGSGAHMNAAHIKNTARPSEGWANCTGCHGNGSLNPATHTKTMPVTPSKISINVDDRFKFNASYPLGPGQYSGLLVDGGANATGTCSNVKCHFQKTTKWSAVK